MEGQDDELKERLPRSELHEGDGKQDQGDAHGGTLRDRGTSLARHARDVAVQYPVRSVPVPLRIIQGQHRPAPQRTTTCRDPTDAPSTVSDPK